MRCPSSWAWNHPSIPEVFKWLREPPLNYETADIARHIQDLVLNSTALPGFLENLAVFCADELSRFSGDVSCGITVLRPSGAPVMGGSDERSRSLEDLRPDTVKGRK